VVNTTSKLTVAIAVLLWLALPASAVAATRVVDPCPVNAVAGWCGDGGPAVDARLTFPSGVSVMSDGGFLITDSLADVVRRVAPNGVITRIAGIGLNGDSGDGGLATAAQLDAPVCAQQQADGSILIADARDVRRVAPDGIISTVGTVAPTCTESLLPDGDRLVIEQGGFAINAVAPDGTVRRVAGTGECGAAGDGGLASEAMLAQATSVTALPDGGFLIADGDNHIVRRVGPDGIISTVAGRNRLAPDCGASGSYGTPIYLLLMQPLSGRAHRTLTVRYETTYPVSVRFTISQGKRTLARVNGRGQTGIDTATLHVSLGPGTYTLQLRGQGLASNPSDAPPSTPFTKTDTERLTIRR
jgi:hypothetical protein